MAKVFKKPVIWRGNSFENLKKFSDVAKQSAVFQLDLVQEGEEPLDSKTMPTIGAGVREILIWAEKGYRVSISPSLLKQYTCFMRLKRRHKKLQN